MGGSRLLVIATYRMWLQRSPTAYELLNFLEGGTCTQVGIKGVATFFWRSWIPLSPLSERSGMHSIGDHKPIVDIWNTMTMMCGHVEGVWICHYRPLPTKSNKHVQPQTGSYVESWNTHFPMLQNVVDIPVLSFTRKYAPHLDEPDSMHQWYYKYWLSIR